MGNLGKKSQIMNLVHQIPCGVRPGNFRFSPFTTVDYSGGMIITDWYSEGVNSNKVSLKLR